MSLILNSCDSLTAHSQRAHTTHIHHREKCWESVEANACRRNHVSCVCAHANALVTLNTFEINYNSLCSKFSSAIISSTALQRAPTELAEKKTKFYENIFLVYFAKHIQCDSCTQMAARERKQQQFAYVNRFHLSQRFFFVASNRRRSSFVSAATETPWIIQIRFGISEACQMPDKIEIEQDVYRLCVCVHRWSSNFFKHNFRLSTFRRDIMHYYIRAQHTRKSTVFNVQR